MLQVTTVVSVSTIFMLLQDVGVAVNTTSLHGRALRILWRITQWPFVESQSSWRIGARALAARNCVARMAHAWIACCGTLCVYYMFAISCTRDCAKI